MKSNDRQRALWCVLLTIGIAGCASPSARELSPEPQSVAKASCCAPEAVASSGDVPPKAESPPVASESIGRLEILDTPVVDPAFECRACAIG